MAQPTTGHTSDRQAPAEGQSAAIQASPVRLRPIGTPLPLGLFGLAAASFIVSGLEFGWIPMTQRLLVGVIIVAFPVALQLTAAILSFLARDGAAGSALGVLSTTWLSIGAVYILSKPGSTSAALGLLLLVSGAALTLSGAAGGLTKLVPALVLVVSGARFAATGVYELTRIAPWQDVSAAIGLGLTALALYTAFALELEGARGKPLLPLLRRGVGRRAVDGSLEAQLEGVASEPGVRKTL